jgi:hypothetical protein
MLTGVFGSEQQNQIFINLIYFSKFVVVEKDFKRRKDDLNSCYDLKVGINISCSLVELVVWSMFG